MGNVIFVAGQHIDPQDQSPARQHVGVIGVRGTAGFVRIVADLGAFLMAVQGLHRTVHVEHPRLVQQRRSAVVQVVLQPGQPVRFADLGQATAHQILAANLAHAEQGRIHRITAQRGDVGVAAMAGQHRQQDRAQQVALLRCVMAGQ